VHVLIAVSREGGVGCAVKGKRAEKEEKLNETWARNKAGNTSFS